MYVCMVEIEKSTYFFSITLGILNSSFVPAVGHLQVCLKKKGQKNPRIGPWSVGETTTAGND